MPTVVRVMNTYIWKNETDQITGQSALVGLASRPVAASSANRHSAPSARRATTNHSGGIRCTTIFMIGQLRPQISTRMANTP